MVEAKENYEEAEEALTKFLGNNQVDILATEIRAKGDTLSDYYATNRQLDPLVANGKALRDCLRKGTSSSGMADDLSILLLRASVFTLLSSGLPAQLQLSVEHATGIEGRTEKQIQDLDTLIAVLEARREEVQRLINEGALQREVLRLREQLEREQARQRELTQERDLAWETYQTLAWLEGGGGAGRDSGEGHRGAVRCPSSGAQIPRGPNKKLNTAIAGVLGLMLAMFAAFLLEYFEGGREREREGTEEDR